MTRTPVNLCMCGQASTIEHIFNDCQNFQLSRQKHQINGIQSFSEDDFHIMMNVTVKKYFLIS